MEIRVLHIYFNWYLQFSRIVKITNKGVETLLRHSHFLESCKKEAISVILMHCHNGTGIRSQRQRKKAYYRGISEINLIGR